MGDAQPFAKARLIGINHVALEVGDLDQALALYERLFGFTYRGRSAGMAFLDMGDQFLAMAGGRTQPADAERHFGLVVDRPDAVLAAAHSAGLRATRGRTGSVDLWDPWGNHIQVVAYADVQFERVAGVKRALGIEDIAKSDAARREIAARHLD
jgi:lactoylglutathione lyase